MDITEIIGFLISLGFLLFLFLKQGWDASARKKHPEEYAKKQREKEKRLKEFMKSMDIQVEEDDDELEEEKMTPKAKIQERSQMRQRSAGNISKRLDSLTPLSMTSRRQEKYEVKLSTRRIVYTATKEMPSRGYNLIKMQHSFQDIILLNEIIGAPRGSPFGAYRDRSF